MNAPLKHDQEAASEHKSAYAAVASAMGSVRRIAKDNRNAEQKYDFASIDDFMAMVGPICAANGLVTIMDEDGAEFIEKPGKYGVTHWVRLKYQITTWHTSGGSLPTVTRHVEVIRSGPQAYGSAQSYILKQYYRGLLNIPTGDKDDPDFGDEKAETVPSDRSDDRLQRDDTPVFSAKGAADRIIASIGKRQSVEEIEHLYREERQTIENVKVASHGDYLRVMDEFSARKKALMPANPIDEAEIPY